MIAFKEEIKLCGIDVILQRTIEEEEGAGEADDDHRWTKRTQNVLNSISTKLKSSATEEVHYLFLVLYKLKYEVE